MTLHLEYGPAGSNLIGTSSASASAGPATFSNIAVTTSGLGYVLVATAPRLPSATSNPFNIVASSPAITFSPAQVGVGIDSTATITLPGTVGASPVYVTVTNNNWAAARPIASIVPILPGQSSATFLVYGEAAGQSVISLTASGWTSVSAPISVVPLPASQLVFTTNPTNVSFGSPLTSALRVIALDSTGHEVATGSYPIQLSLGSNPGGALLNGVTAGTWNNTSSGGFPGLTVTQPGIGYTLVASSPGLQSAVSSAFNVLGGPLSVSLTGSSVRVGSNLTGTVALPQPSGSTGVFVSVQNASPATLQVNPASVFIPAGQRSASFTLTGVAAGSAQLTLSSPAYTNVSTAVSVTPLPASQLVFATNPSNVSLGSPLTSSLRVLALDSTGQEVTTGSYPIQISLGNNSNGAVLNGATTGVWTGTSSGWFPGLTLSQPGIGYTLIASSPGLQSAVSSAFNVVGGPVNVSLPSSSVQVGSKLTGTITLPQPAGAAGAILSIQNDSSSTLQVNPASVAIPAGQSSATFTLSGVAVGSAQLTISAPAYTNATAAVSVTPLPATQLLFATSPSTVSLGSPLTSSLRVIALDSTGHAVATGSYPIQLSLGSNPGGALLNGTTSGTWTGFSSGWFPGLTVTQPGSGYTLIASSPGLQSAVSSSFSVLGGPLNMSLPSPSVQVGSSVTGTITLPQPSGAAGTTISIQNGSSATLQVSPASVFIPAGQSSATFTLTGGAAGSSQVTISAPAYTNATATVSVTPLPASQLVFTTNPSNVSFGTPLTSSLRVLALDSTGQEVTTGSYPIQLSLGNNPSGAVLNGATSGVWSGTSSGWFPGLTLSQPGIGYTLIASSPGLQPAVSSSFNVVGGALNVSLPSSPVQVDGTQTGTVTLPEPAGAVGVNVSIENGSPATLQVNPASVLIPAGASSATFTITGLVPGTSQLTFSSPAYTSTTATATTGGVIIPGSYFGMEVLNFENLAPAFSYGTVRTWDAYPAMDWADQNPSAGKYNFVPLQAYIAQNQALGRDIIYTFGRTPPWASTNPKQAGAYSAGECAPPTNMQNWTNFVQAVVTAAAGKIKYWELWDEANDPLFFCGNISTMITMAQSAASIIRSIDPTALILAPSVDGGAPVNGTPSLTWLGEFLAGGGSSAVDIAAFHGYLGSSPENIVSEAASYKQLLATNGMTNTPIWDTESSWGAAVTNPTLAFKEGFVAKDYLLHWSSGVPGLVWYAYDGSSTWGGMYVAGTGQNAAAQAYSETYQWMVGAVMTSPCAKGAGSIWTCGLARTGYSAEAVWIPGSTATFPVPAQFVQYRDLSGVVHPITGTTVPVGDEPILLETGNPPATLPN